MRLIVDMDDVMSACTEQFQAWYCRDFGTRVHPSLLLNKKFSDAVPAGHRDVVLDYPNRRGFFGQMTVIKGSQDALKTLALRYDVYIVSLATEFKYSLEEKHNWLEANFNFIGWNKWVFCGDKSIVHGDIMIDDNTFNLDSFPGRKILFDAPHNAALTNFERARNWREVVSLLS